MISAAAAAAAANLAWWAAGVPSYAAFCRALRDPRRAQERILAGYVRRNADTAFGRAHGFAAVRSVADYQRRVPLSDYDGHAAWIDRVARGERGVLTAEPVTRLATSSGSTRAAKLIPYTASLQREFSRAIAPWIFDLYRETPSLAGGCAYWSISPVATDPPRPNGNDGCAVPVGFEEDSAYLGGVARRLVDAAMAVPGCVRHIRSMESFRYVTALLLLGRPDLRLVSVWHPSFFSLLLDAMRQHWGRLLDDLAAGTCSPPDALEPGVADRLRRHRRPAPRRAEQLRHVSPRDYVRIWPKLGLISCWAHAHASLAASTLGPTFPGVRVQAKGLIATETFVTLPFRGGWPPAVTSHFFEFLDDSGGRPRLADELEPGRVYSVVVTTAGGLWRYQLRDRVRVTGRIDNAPSLCFLGKEDHVVDLFGEKLNEAWVAEVLGGVFRAGGVGPRFAMLAPDDRDGHTAYTLYLEAAEPPAPGLARALDGALGENPHYAYCRRLGQLGPARVFRVDRDAFASFLGRCRELGQRAGDVKPSPLSRHAGWSAVFAGDYLPAGE